MAGFLPGGGIPDLTVRPQNFAIDQPGQIAPYNATSVLNSYRQGQSDATQQQQTNLLKQVGGIAATGGLGAASQAALAGGNVEMGTRLSALDTERKARVLDLVGQAAEQADTPEKWKSLNTVMTNVFGPGSMNNFEDFKSRDAALMLVQHAKMQLIQTGVPGQPGAVQNAAVDLQRPLQAPIPIGAPKIPVEKPPAGYIRDQSGALTFEPGGPADPATAAAATAARTKAQTDVIANSEEAQTIGDGIISGDQPPTTTGLYRVGPGVRSYVAKKDFNLAKAQLQYDAAKKQVASLNGPQAIRWLTAAQSVVNTIDEVTRLADAMDQSGVPAYNQLKLKGWVQTAGNSEGGQLATRYINATNTLQEEMAVLAQQGYTPTEPAWKLAGEQTNRNYGDKQIRAALDESKRLIKYRMNSIPGNTEFGPNAPNAYKQGGAAGATVPSSLAGRTLQFNSAMNLYRDKQTGEMFNVNGEPVSGQ